VEKGRADLTITNKQKSTVIDFAEEEDSGRCFELLKQLSLV
jgi:hypothetical protein